MGTLTTYVVTYRHWTPQTRLLHAYGPWDAARKAEQMYGETPDEVELWTNTTTNREAA
jgi:hypothetical protein